jgi:hypothetical protein
MGVRLRPLPRRVCAMLTSLEPKTGLTCSHRNRHSLHFQKLTAHICGYNLVRIAHDKNSFARRSVT